MLQEIQINNDNETWQTSYQQLIKNMQVKN
jgi:hypothetical protein